MQYWISKMGQKSSNENSSHNYLACLDTTPCVGKVIVDPWQRLKGHRLQHFLLVFLFTYCRESVIGYGKQCCAVSCHNLANEMSPFHQHVPPPCCITLITHSSLHNWNKHKSEGWRGEGWCEVDVMQADGEISAEVKETKGADGRLPGEMKGEGLEGKKWHGLSQKDYQIKGRGWRWRKIKIRWYRQFHKIFCMVSSHSKLTNTVPVKSINRLDVSPFYCFFHKSWWSTPPSQYFVHAPLSSIRALSLFGQVSVRHTPLDSAILLHYSL